MRNTRMYSIVFIILELFTQAVSVNKWFQSGQEELRQALNSIRNENRAKNVILFVGDGMGVSTVTAARIFKGQQQGRTGEEGLLEFERFPHIGLSKVYNSDKQVPDSAATATAFLCGVKTNYNTLGVDDTAIFDNCASQERAKVDCVFDWFRNAKRSTGVVSTARITHATPAAGYAKAVNRGWEGDTTLHGVRPEENCKDIAHQLIFNNPQIQVIFGGGRRYFIRKEDPDPEENFRNFYSQRSDGINLINLWKYHKEYHGHKAEYVWNNRQFDNIDVNNTDFVLGLFSPSHMDFEADRDTGPLGEPSLANMTSKAIKLLQRNNKGFFLLVEGARIDHAHHTNNAKRALLETLAFEDAVKAAIDLTSEEDTLIIVTADHSHVMSIAGTPKRGNDILGVVDPIIDQPKDGLPYTTLVYGNGPGYEGGFRRNLSILDTSDINFRQTAAVPMDFETHGGEDVSIYARGPMSHLFHSVHEQHYIAHVMAYAACVGKNRSHCKKTFNKNNHTQPRDSKNSQT